MGPMLITTSPQLPAEQINAVLLLGLPPYPFKSTVYTRDFFLKVFGKSKFSLTQRIFQVSGKHLTEWLRYALVHMHTMSECLHVRAISAPDFSL